MKLISMTDFVLEQNTEFAKDKPIHETDWNLEFEKFSKLMISYANFLKQPLQLGMFVPCDENGNVLEEPDPTNWQNFTPDGRYRNVPYQKAKEKVLFEGFEYCFDETNSIIELEFNDMFINYNIEEDLFFLDSWNGDAVIMNLECLCNLLNNTASSIKLTESAIKQLGL